MLFRSSLIKVNGFSSPNEFEKFVNETWKKNEHNTFLVGLGEDGEIHTEVGDYFDYVGVYNTYEIYDLNLEDRIKEQTSIWKKSYFRSTETTI